jgi:FtsP/CotA-like multicopper oxidase with cupredoxin domain
MIRHPRPTYLAFALSLMMLPACGDDDPALPVVSAFKTRLPFSEPPELVSSNGVLDVAITSAPTMLDVSGMEVRGESYNGTFVGPTLHVEPGDQIRLSLQNDLQQMTNIHFHGFHVSPSGMSDNVLRHVAAGATASYVIDIPPTHEQGLFWYHSHMHMDSESQVFQGLSAAIQVGDVRRLLPERFRDIRRRVLALKDLQVEDGAIVAANIDSNAPTTRTVNGLVDPTIDVARGSTELWQIANISADIFYDVEVHGRTLLVVGEDGNPVETTFEEQHLVMPPGKRFEVLVTFPDPGEIVFRTRHYDQQGDVYPETALAHVVVDSGGMTPLEPLAAGTPLAQPTDLLDRPVVAQRTWAFTENDAAGEFFINERQFDENRVDVSPKLGTVEEWTLENQTMEQHPFHIHVNDFRVLSVGGQPYAAKGDQDTVVLYPMQPVVIRVPFDDFTGKFVFHCHILNHEDSGMMALVDVVP